MGAFDKKNRSQKSRASVPLKLPVADYSDMPHLRKYGSFPLQCFGSQIGLTEAHFGVVIAHPGAIEARRVVIL